VVDQLFLAYLAFCLLLGIASNIKMFSFFFVVGTVLPLTYLPINSFVPVFYPSLLITIGYISKQLIQKRQLNVSSDIPKINFGIVFIAYMLSSTLWSTNFRQSFGFIVSFIIMLVVLPRVNFPIEVYENITKYWIGLSMILSIYGIIEWIAKENVILNQLNATQFLYSGAYRIQTFIGHPLMNGTFFGITAVLSLSLFLKYKKNWHLIASVLCQIALLLTFSRGAIFATLVVILATVILAARNSQSSKKMQKKIRLSKLTVVFISGLFAVFSFYVIELRDNSVSGITSSNTRRQINNIITNDLRFNFFGSGAGTSQTLFSQTNGGLILENSIIQLVIGVGFVGVILFLAGVLQLYLRGVSHKELLLPAMLTYTISASNFNMIEGCRASHAYFALICFVSNQYRQKTDFKKGNEL
jgi:hypothetical protein